MARHRSISAIVAGLLLAIIATPAGAAGGPSTTSAPEADQVVAMLGAPGPRGIVAIRDGTSNATMVAELLGLPRTGQVRVVASSAACTKDHQTADRVLALRVQGGSDRASFTSTTFDDEAVAGSIRSVRLFQASNEIDCARARPYSAAAAGEALPTEWITLNIFDGASAQGMVVIDGGPGGDPVTVALHGLSPGVPHRLIGADVECTDPPSEGSRLFKVPFTSSAKGTHYSSGDGDGNGYVDAVDYLVLKQGSQGLACSSTQLLVPAPRP